MGSLLTIHSFFDPAYNNNSMRGLVEAKRNMEALLAKGYDEAYFNNLRSDKKHQYLIDFKRLTLSCLDLPSPSRGFRLKIRLPSS